MTCPKDLCGLITVQQVRDSKPHQRQETYLLTSDSVLGATDTNNIEQIVDHPVICCNSVGFKIFASKSRLL